MASMIAAPMRMSRSDSRDISSCQVRCSCSVSPRAAEKSCGVLVVAGPGRFRRPGDLRIAPVLLVGDVERLLALGALGVAAGGASGGSALGAGDSNCGSASGSAVSRLPASSSASSITLLSSASRICAWSSSTGSCSRRMACCSCGVIVSCWPSLSCRAGLSIRLATSGARSGACQQASRAPKISSKIYSLKSWPKYTSRTCRFARISSAVPAAITEPPLTM